MMVGIYMPPPALPAHAHAAHTHDGAALQAHIQMDQQVEGEEATEAPKEEAAAPAAKCYILVALP